MDALPGYRKVTTSGRLQEGGVYPHYFDDVRRRVSIARVAGTLYAFDDLCSHDAAPLSAGLLSGTTLMCQCDGSQFDIASGQVVRGPAVTELATYPVLEADGEILVRL
jgi:nitrite reductase/ring-hydroxylating ferredoxin subunit